MTEQTHWLIRVGDGENFKKSKHPFWGIKRGPGGGIKTIINKFKQGDILWFITSKKYGGNVVGMSEYVNCHDREDEPLTRMHTYSNDEQNWKSGDDWDIQVYYTNLYVTERQNIGVIVQCSATVLEYEKFKSRGLPDLYMHYKNFKYYAESKKINLCDKSSGTDFKQKSEEMLMLEYEIMRMNLEIEKILTEAKPSLS
jgi:hypothetical protein